MNAAQASPPLTRVALYGNFGRGNLGNECTLAAARFGLANHLDECELFAVGAFPENLSSLHGLPAVAINADEPSSYIRVNEPRASLPVRLLRRIRNEWREFLRARRTLRGTDAFLVIGTGILEDDTGALGWFISLLRWLMAARLSGCVVGFVSVGAGPVRPGVPSLLVRLHLRLAHFVSYRDEFSRDWMQRIGVKVNDHAVMPDLAFALEHTSRAARPTRIAARPGIGLGVMEIESLSDSRITSSSQEEYLEQLGKLLREIAKAGSDVNIVYGDTAYDAGVAEHLLERSLRSEELSSESVALRGAGSFEELMDALAEQDVVIASRFHNLILSLLLGKPVIGLAYHDKHRDLLTQFGLGDFVHDLLAFDAEQVAAQVAVLLTDREVLAARINNRVAEYRDRLNFQFVRLAALCRTAR